jgi:sigma-B regulation protein RsbU (phosphoserine phosphatase)
MSTTSVDELIRLVPALASLPSHELESLATAMHFEQFAVGTLLLREGEAGERLYLLREGQVEIVKALGTDGERLLGVRGPGSFIGEMSLFNHEGLHTASVRARTALGVFSMKRRDAVALLSRQPALAYDVMRTMSQRLDESENLTIHDLLEKNRQLTRAYEDLRAAQAQLLEKERMEAELQVARSIQRSILPRATPHLPGYDLGMLIEPVSSVGGDLCDFVPLKGSRLGIAIGDVSGHGVGSALFMALAFSLLRAEASRGAPPARVLRNVNRLLLDMGDSGMFVTMLYGVLDGPGRQFSYARAGHPQPLLMDARGDPLSPPLGTGQLLGLFEDLVLDEQTVAIPPGGWLLLYTDGAPEAIDADRCPFGQERLYDTMRRAQGGSAQGLCQAAYEAVRSFCGAQAPEDDILFVAVQAQ